MPITPRPMPDMRAPIKMQTRRIINCTKIIALDTCQDEYERIP